MHFPEIERIVLDLVDAFVAAGVSREAAEDAARGAEVVAMLDLIETESDERIVGLFKQYGSAAVAERKRVCQRTATRHYNDALERLARKKIGQDMSEKVDAKAA